MSKSVAGTPDFHSTPMQTFPEMVIFVAIQRLNPDWCNSQPRHGYMYLFNALNLTGVTVSLDVDV